MKKYCEIVKLDNSKSYAYYNYQINWIVENIINDNCFDGYIVQKVKIENSTNIKEIRNVEYLEAWKVSNGKYIEHSDKKADDSFMFLDECFESECLELSIGKSGNIIYNAEVYWISVKNSLYKKIDLWEKGLIPEAGRDLKSIYFIDFPQLHRIEPVIIRPTFKHTVSFADSNIVQKGIEECFKKCIAKRDPKFQIKLREMLANTQYSNIINNICGK